MIFSLWFLFLSFLNQFVICEEIVLRPLQYLQAVQTVQSATKIVPSQSVARSLQKCIVIKDKFKNVILIMKL
ncbi:hypothetical protein I7I50_08860 [Histoplasma capsulatum G186AR]|uniref:Secreted protein n=1 Tax=Ajellomyces capsulatus TaxID=5037 RepID=A0A8H8CZ87_AJECA|nr:hypothetical protein I7I52_06374 [Histoplasma capsulatum]QSS73919.1 hypothetical protein I7I50_08860 [Histoplasma capsulatum G186AR]